MKPKLKPLSLSERAQKVLDNAAEFNSDFAQLLYQLEELRTQCTNGITIEKVSASSNKPIAVTEAFPAVAKACIMGKLTVLQEAYKIAQTKDESAEPLEININLMDDPRSEKPSELD